MGLIARWRGLRRLRGVSRASGSLGRLSIPGAAAVALPAGELQLCWEERRSSYVAFGDSISLSAPADLAVSLRAPDGAELPLQPAGGHNQYAEAVRIRGDTATADFVRIRLATVDVPTAGSHRLEASATL